MSNSPRLPDDVQAALLLAQDALRWCSGSPDFNEGGQARVGWMSPGGPRDALDAIDTVLRGASAQGRCETTLTERFKNPSCKCDTYPDNLGPCRTFEEGARCGYCVYCDHNLRCHKELAGEPFGDECSSSPIDPLIGPTTTKQGVL